MADTATDAYRALRQVSRAIKRGDLAAAERWTAVMNARLAMAQRIGDLIARRPQRNLRRYRAVAPNAQTTQELGEPPSSLKQQRYDKLAP